MDITERSYDVTHQQAVVHHFTGKMWETRYSQSIANNANNCLENDRLFSDGNEMGVGISAFYL